MKTSELIKWYRGKVEEGFSEEEIDRFLSEFESGDEEESNKEETGGD